MDLILTISINVHAFQDSSVRPCKYKIYLTNHFFAVPISENKVEALFITDTGDDPDITHKAKIGARVTLSDSNEINAFETGYGE